VCGTHSAAEWDWIPVGFHTSGIPHLLSYFRVHAKYCRISNRIQARKFKKLDFVDARNSGISPEATLVHDTSQSWNHYYHPNE
jgi:hypothetical protein